jgi:hypothetical protein
LDPQHAIGQQLNVHRRDRTGRQHYSNGIFPANGRITSIHRGAEAGVNRQPISVAPDEKRYPIHKQRQDHKLTRDLHVRRVEEPHPDPVGTICN